MLRSPPRRRASALARAGLPICKSKWRRQRLWQVILIAAAAADGATEPIKTLLLRTKRLSLHAGRQSRRPWRARRQCRQRVEWRAGNGGFPTASLQVRERQAQPSDQPASSGTQLLRLRRCSQHRAWLQQALGSPPELGWLRRETLRPDQASASHWPIQDGLRRAKPDAPGPIAFMAPVLYMPCPPSTCAGHRQATLESNS